MAKLLALERVLRGFASFLALISFSVSPSSWTELSLGPLSTESVPHLLSPILRKNNDSSLSFLGLEPLSLLNDLSSRSHLLFFSLFVQSTLASSDTLQRLSSLPFPNSRNRDNWIAFLFSLPSCGVKVFSFSLSSFPPNDVIPSGVIRDFARNCTSHPPPPFPF